MCVCVCVCVPASVCLPLCACVRLSPGVRMSVSVCARLCVSRLHGPPINCHPPTSLSAARLGTQAHRHTHTNTDTHAHTHTHTHTHARTQTQTLSLDAVADVIGRPISNFIKPVPGQRDLLSEYFDKNGDRKHSAVSSGASREEGSHTHTHECTHPTRSFTERKGHTHTHTNAHTQHALSRR